MNAMQRRRRRHAHQVGGRVKQRRLNAPQSLLVEALLLVLQGDGQVQRRRHRALRQQQLLGVGAVLRGAGQARGRGDAVVNGGCAWVGRPRQRAPSNSFSGSEQCCGDVEQAGSSGWGQAAAACAKQAAASRGQSSAADEPQPPQQRGGMAHGQRPRPCTALGSPSGDRKAPKQSMPRRARARRLLGPAEQSEAQRSPLLAARWCAPLQRPGARRRQTAQTP